jgi:fatty-acyl-CoA synthase
MDISGWIERWADFAPDKMALRFEGVDIDYAGFDRRIRAVARALAGELGIVAGDRVAYLGYNHPDMLALLFACARLGAMLVPLNWRLATAEHLFILHNAEPRALVCEPDFQPAIGGIRDRLGGCALIGLGGAGEGWQDFEGLVGAPGPDAADRHDGVSLETALLIVYTSGTTGRPKGAVLTQNAMTFNAVNSTVAHDLVSGDVVLTNLPMFHVGGLNIQTVPALHSGASVVLQRRYSLAAMVEAIRIDRPSLTVMVPAVLKDLVEHPGFDDLDLSSLRLINTGSTTVPVSYLDAVQARGIPVTQVYGSTETAPIVIHQRAADAFATVGSTGKPAIHCEARIMDPDGRILEPGEKGEIVVRGPNILREYWRDPEATAAALRGGWYHTGDIGHQDERGYYYVDDRRVDMIISGSENIYPAELETVLDDCAELVEAAVVGRPDARWGMVPVVYAVRRAGSTITDQAVLALFHERLARFKHPRAVFFVDALPRNVVGKVQKFTLRDWAAGEDD